ncbi:MAG: hypothetical protein JXX14_17215 [Deltaproteobacteria bacterium]|nr:hypothetical protein [Deltaproteobacteria bacterium]
MANYICADFLSSECTTSYIIPMFRVAKFLIGFVFFISFCYVLFFVPLGQRTLYQHLRNISGTSEAQELKDGIRQKAEMVTTDVVDSVPELKEVDEKVNAVKKVVDLTATKTEKTDAHGSQTRSTAAEKPMAVSSEDRAALDRLLKSKLN